MLVLPPVRPRICITTDQCDVSFKSLELNHYCYCKEINFVSLFCLLWHTKRICFPCFLGIIFIVLHYLVDAQKVPSYLPSHLSSFTPPRRFLPTFLPSLLSSFTPSFTHSLLPFFIPYSTLSSTPSFTPLFFTLSFTQSLIKTLWHSIILYLLGQKARTVDSIACIVENAAHQG